MFNGLRRCCFCDAVYAAAEWQRDNRNVLKSDRSISELDPSTSPTDSPCDDVDQRKRLPASDNFRCEKWSKRLEDVLEKLDLEG